MKRIILLLATILICLIVALNLKKESEIIQAKFQMLSCENCYHVTVLSAHDESLVSRTLVLESGETQPERVLNESLAKGQSTLCIRGRRALIDLDINLIDPPGISFYVDSLLSADSCTKTDGELMAKK